MKTLVVRRTLLATLLAAAGAPLIDSKSVKALAILTRDRSPLMPNLPSAREQGIEGVDVLSSISRAENSQISVRFKIERNPDSAASDVRDRVAD